MQSQGLGSEGCLLPGFACSLRLGLVNQESSQSNFLLRQFIKHYAIKTEQTLKAIKVKKNQKNPFVVKIEGITWTFSQVSAMVRGPCSFTMSIIALVIVWVCSGGVFSSIGFIFGLGFVEKYLIAALNMISFFKIHGTRMGERLSWW
ncbi:hypothetical protein SADUNF_Sadunf05G0089000 [Salix dunnii]|uniref:Uncharacterized protein n=1 Tax=Salix dunnii TaxID=1413687 RepID=A0A835K189_9ROSI|nr:hypothetical protein SADUNF_Sadunf05G0089000 [Salix dunnii]